MTPVDGLIVSPSGRPEAEKKVGERVPATVKVKGVPWLPAAFPEDVMPGAASTSTLSITWSIPFELNRDAGMIPVARSWKVVAPRGATPVRGLVAGFIAGPAPAVTKWTPSVDSSNSTDEKEGALPV